MSYDPLVQMAYCIGFEVPYHFTNLTQLNAEMLALVKRAHIKKVIHVDNECFDLSYTMLTRSDTNEHCSF